MKRHFLLQVFRTYFRETPRRSGTSSSPPIGNWRPGAELDTMRGDVPQVQQAGPLVVHSPPRGTPPGPGSAPPGTPGRGPP